MSKGIVGIVAVLATAGMAMGFSAAFDFGDVAPVDMLGGAQTITVPLWATGDSEVDALSLALEVQTPLQITGITALQSGMLLGTSNDGGSSYIDASGLAMTFDAFNASTTVHNPALSSTPMLVGNISVLVPAGTAVGEYTISTVSPLFGDYASTMSYGGAGLAVTQDTGKISVILTPEPMTALLGLLGLPMLRRRRA